MSGRSPDRRLRGDGDQFALLTNYTCDGDPIQTSVMLRALGEEAHWNGEWPPRPRVGEEVTALSILRDSRTEGYFRF
ncbi:hypothetical protein [Streptomyces sp. NPDC002611]